MLAWLGGLRLVLAVILFLVGLLAVVKPPAYPLWKLSILVLEGGHWVVIPCLLLAWQAFRGGPGGRIAGQLFLASAMLYGITLPRAWVTASRLANGFRESRGDIVPGPGGFQRSAPISVLDLFRGLSLTQAAPETHVYARKDGLELRLDFYRARRDGPAPCVVAIHGGGWDSGGRGEFGDLNRFLAQGGYAVATLDYRLAPRFKYPAPVEDVRDALAWLKAHADSLGVDPGRFALLGRSAGGQIALQAAYVDPDPAVKGVVAFYAPADMVFGYSLPTNPLILNSRLLMEGYLGGPEPMSHAAYLASSPVEQVSSRIPPTLMLHGRADVLVSYRHMARMRERLGPLGGKLFEVDLPWAAHGYDYIFRGPGSQISLFFLERFLAEATR